MTRPGEKLPPERIVAREITRYARAVARIQLKRRQLNKELAILDDSLRNNQTLLRELVASTMLPFSDAPAIADEQTEQLIDKALGELSP